MEVQSLSHRQQGNEVDAESKAHRWMLEDEEGGWEKQMTGKGRDKEGTSNSNRRRVDGKEEGAKWKCNLCLTVNKISRK